MMVMPADSSNQRVHYWAGKYEGQGKIGWLKSPPAKKSKIPDYMPFALDNGAFGAWTRKEPFNEAAWIELLEHVRMRRLTPLWCLVPDVVADREGTLAAWDKYSPVVDRYGWRKAFAVQDGMTPADVPEGAEVVFVGGTTQWKWRHLRIWTTHFPRVHVGRVNEFRRLLECEKLGVESVDGTGWFRDGECGRKPEALKLWIEGFRPAECANLSF